MQVLVPQVEKMCIDRGLTDESEILRFLQHGTLVGLLPVPHPILIRRYQANPATAQWFRWGSLYHTIPYHTIPYCTITYHTILYHTILYHNLPYHTIHYTCSRTYMWGVLYLRNLDPPIW